MIRRRGVAAVVVDGWPLSWRLETQIFRVQRPADHQINPACMLQVVDETRTCSQPVSATAALNALWDCDGWTAVMAKSAEHLWTNGNFSRHAQTNPTNVILLVFLASDTEPDLDMWGHGSLQQWRPPTL